MSTIPQAPRKGMSNNQSIIILGILLLVAGILVSYQFMIPNLQVANLTLATDQKKVDFANQNVHNINNATFKLAQVKSDLAKRNLTEDSLNRVMPPTEDMPGLYLQMERILVTNPTVSNITYTLGSPTANTAGGGKVPVTISAQSSYASLKAFIVKIQQAQRPIIVDSLSFTVAAATDKSPSTTSLSLSGSVLSKAISPAYLGTR